MVLGGLLELLQDFVDIHFSDGLASFDDLGVRSGIGALVIRFRVLGYIILEL